MWTVLLRVSLAMAIVMACTPAVFAEEVKPPMDQKLSHEALERELIILHGLDQTLQLLQSLLEARSGLGFSFAFGGFFAGGHGRYG